jgi:hypothetical protein
MEYKIQKRGGNYMEGFKEWLNENQNINYENFLQYLKDNNLDVNTLVSKYSKTPPDHKGGNNLFWYIKGTPYGLRMLNQANLGTANYNQTQFDQMNKHQDDLSDIHVGQAIANLGKNIQIVKVQEGQPAGFDYRKKNDPNVKTFISQFAQKIALAARFPQSAYDKIVQDMITIYQRGYVVDASKPANLLINNNGFGFVDVSKSPAPKKYVPVNYLFTMILDPRHLNKIIEEPNMKENAIVVFNKILKAAEDKSSSGYEYSAEIVGLIKQKPEITEEPDFDSF